MHKYFAVSVFVMSAACGGTSIPVAVSNDATTAGTAALTAVTTTTSSTPTTSGNDASFASLLNTMRLDNGAGRVTYNAQLDSAAQAHADDMLANNYFSHTGRDGSSAAQRARRAGYDWRTVGENIATGYRSEETVFNGWTNSPGHHANNINPAFEEFGLGYAGNGTGTRWVLMLGAQ